MKNIFVLGGVSYNLIIDVDEFPQPVAHTISSVNSYRETIGNTGAGKALNLNKLGFNVTFYGVIGQDDYGEKIASTFHQEGITFGYDVSPNGTERHLNFMKNATGERLSIFLNSIPEINTNIEVVEQYIRENDIVFLNIMSYCKDFIPLLKKYNKEIWVDLHDYDGKNEYHQDFIDAADVIQFSSENNPEYQETIRKFLSDGKKLVVCTHGSKGSTIANEKEWLDVPALKYDAIDTNGAGDAYSAGILYGVAQGYDLEKTAKIASIAGGMATTSKQLASEELSCEKVEDEYRKVKSK
ncbi:carbohydrate kinase family protein [Neobacillus mesonae]|uniref:Carbohydrate kinase PfkB domain-containing protein n=1 Tax=Neobacillus mesonae TaxID=1193713 RepID=A0A3Q9R1Q1_9BACI|nr:PfkB family carbohydrate kinase [Neobacillus mesonae]AZU64519.1 hypothetical protein CHR53_26640 [Neobacillus mesonae]